MTKPLVVIVANDDGCDIHHAGDVTVVWVDDNLSRGRVYEASSHAASPLSALMRYLGPRKYWSNARRKAPADPLRKGRIAEALDPTHRHSLCPADNT
mgnify:CR=1 FL=1|jgi:hypothetical protein